MDTVTQPWPLVRQVAESPQNESTAVAEDRMSEALKGVCDTLSLKLTDGPETRLVA